MAVMDVLTPFTKSTPPWLKDYPDRDVANFPGGARLDPTQFFASDSVRVVTTGAAAGATSIPATALEGPIPLGAVLDFGGALFARTSAAVAQGATAVPVVALAAAIPASTGRYAGTGMKTVLSGIMIGRTYAERDANIGFGPVAESGGNVTDDEVFLLLDEVTDADKNPDCTLTRHFAVVAENFLPRWGNAAEWTTAKITRLRALYRTTKGAA